MSWAAKKHTPLYRYISKLVAVQTNKDGGSLSECLCVDSKVTMKHLSAIASDFDLEKMARDRLKVPWDDVAVKHIRASDALSKRKFVEAFDHQVAMIQAFCRVASAETRWVLQTFYTSCQDLYDLAIAADEQLVRRDEKPLKLEETARIANRVFSVCINDREDNVKASRQWGTYYIANLLFKIYFR
ncbi:COP9 signalosome (CSN) subunit, partial [Spiromyces aspiralis]